jgi:hypothetical protein
VGVGVGVGITIGVGTTTGINSSSGSGIAGAVLIGITPGEGGKSITGKPTCAAFI